MQIHVSRDGQQFGPYTKEQVRAYLNAGHVRPDDLAWHQGAPNWMPVSALLTLQENTPPPSAWNMKKLVVVAAVGLAVWLVVIVLAVLFNNRSLGTAGLSTAANDPPGPGATRTALPAERVARGEKTFTLMKSKRLEVDPQVRGLATDSSVVSVFITQEVWDGLSKSEQIDFTYYAESLVPQVRSQAEKYVDTPTSAPVYDTFLSRTRNLCDDCWDIILGRPVRSNGVNTFTVDSTLVQGDTPWSKADPCCRGVRASEFRGEPGQTSTEVPAPTSPKDEQPFQTETSRRMLAVFFIKPVLREMLHDPSSLQDLQVTSVTPDPQIPGSYSVEVSYRAKNAFGALVAQQQEFVVTRGAGSGLDAWRAVPVAR